MPSGFRTVFRAQKFLRTVRAFEERMVRSPAKVAGIMKRCIEVISGKDCIPNITALQQIVLSLFTSDSLRDEAFSLLRKEGKLAETSLRASCKHMREIEGNQFFMWRNQSGNQHVVVVQAEPHEYGSWADMMHALGGLERVIQTDKVTEEQFVLLVYGYGFKVPRGYNAAVVTDTLWPWTEDNAADPVGLRQRYERVRATVRHMIRIWRAAGLDHLLHIQLPHSWEPPTDKDYKFSSRPMPHGFFFNVDCF